MTKHLIGSFVGSLIFLALFATTALAQDQYEWDTYGIGFSVASDILIMENDSESFSAVTSDGEIAISISPWLDESVDEDSLAEAALSVAIELYAVDDSQVDGDYVELDTFNGYYLVAAQNDEDQMDYLLIALLLDTESETNLVVAIGFEDGNEDEAIDMLASFYTY